MEYNSFTRIHHEDQEIKVVKQMPTIASNKQPTIAIITAQYCEKLAVDSMLENKETFVRYTTVGKEKISLSPRANNFSLINTHSDNKNKELKLFSLFNPFSPRIVKQNEIPKIINWHEKKNTFRNISRKRH